MLGIPINRIFFYSIFLITLCIQLWLWSGIFTLNDEQLWAMASSNIAAGTLPEYSTPTPAHPGITIILPTAGLILLGLLPVDAIHIVMAILMAMCLTCIVYLCRFLRPESLWWTSAGIFLVPVPLYLEITPPSALATLLMCIYILLVLTIREKGSSRENLFFLGVCGGLLLSTRIDNGLSIIAFAAVYLWPLIGKNILRTLGITLLFAAALNPYIWHDPSGYILTFLYQVQDNVTGINPFGSFSYSLHLFELPVVSFIIGAVALYSPWRLTSLPKDFLKWLLATCALIPACILLSQYHPMRYFFPFMTILVLFLPLLLVEAIDNSLKAVSISQAKLVRYGAILFVVVLQSISFYNR